MPGKPFRSLGFYAVDWIETFLVHGPGDVQGRRVRLDDEFAEFVVKAYQVDGRGQRRVRRAFLSRAKGRAKSELAAMIECFEALGECRFDHWAQPGEVSDWGYVFEPGEPVGRQLMYAECLNVATEEGQAGNTFDNVFYMLHRDTCAPELLARFGPLDVGLTRINLPNFRGIIEPATASNESKDGAKSTFVVADESHLWIPPGSGVNRLARMHQTIVRNLLKRKEASGWMLETSTMYVEGEKSVAEGTHAYAKALAASGRSESLLFDHKQASEHWDLHSRSDRIKALKEAYGPAAAWMDLRSIADYWDDPQASHAEFRRFWLNQPVPLADVKPFDITRWVELRDPDVGVPDRVALVADVSPDRKWSCIGVAGEVGHRMRVECYSMPGMAGVADKIAELVAAGGVDEVAVTSGQARALEPDLTRLGIEYRRMSGSEAAAGFAAFQQAVQAGAVTHSGQRELDAAVAGVRARRLASGEVEVVDRREITVDVSPLVACSAAFYRYGLLEAPMPAIY